MRNSPMFKEENALPCSKLHFSVRDRQYFARARQRHADVRWHIIAAFGAVREVIGILGHQVVEEVLQIAARSWIGIFHDDDAATGVLNKNRSGPISNAASVDLRLNFIGDFVQSLSVSADFELIVINVHRQTKKALMHALVIPRRTKGDGSHYCKHKTRIIPSVLRKSGCRCVVPHFARDDRLFIASSQYPLSIKLGQHPLRVDLRSSWWPINLMECDIERVLFDQTAIHRRLDELAAQILNDYRQRELTVIAVLTGSLMFVADLLRRIPLPLKLDCLCAVSYHGKTETSGQVIFKQVALSDATERHILILDDILDSGHTLAAIRDKLEAAKARSIRICVLLSKRKTRACHVDADYVGFEIEDEFVVGYGLDFMERYRNLPYIGVLRKELLEKSSG